LNNLPEKTLILVEGKTDVQMIKQLICDATKYVVMEKRNIYKILDGNVEFNYILVLTDFDTEGECLHQKIREKILSYGYNEDQILDYARKYLRKELSRYGESIYGCIKHLIDYIGGLNKNLICEEVHTSYHKKDLV